MDILKARKKARKKGKQDEEETPKGDLSAEASSEEPAARDASAPKGSSKKRSKARKPSEQGTAKKKAAKPKPEGPKVAPIPPTADAAPEPTESAPAPTGDSAEVFAELERAEVSVSMAEMLGTGEQVRSKPEDVGPTEEPAGAEKSRETTESAAGEGEDQDIDDVLAELEAEPSGHEPSTGHDEALGQSVADFLATFPAEETDEERTYRHSFARTEEGPDNLERYLHFRLAGEDYALRLSSVRETIKPSAITEVPLNPPYVAGIIALRGVILPVIDLRKRLGLAAGERTKKTRILIAQGASGVVGLLVDEVYGVVDVGVDSIEPPPLVLPVSEAEFLDGIGRTASLDPAASKALILLDLDTIARVNREMVA